MKQRFTDEQIIGMIKEHQTAVNALGLCPKYYRSVRKHYNTKRPHRALSYRPPAPETTVQMDPRPIRR